MLSFSAKPTVDPLVREQREIERRKARLEDRRLRILNAKNRIMGIDTQALEQQIKEKQDRADRDRFLQAEQEKMALEAAQMALDKELELQRGARQQQLQLAKERELQATIYKAKINTMQKVDRELEVTQATCPFLKFKGEDDDKLSRTKMQQQQQSDWIAQQMLEKKIQQEKDKQAKDQRDFELLEACRMAKESELLFKTQRAANVAEVQQYNLMQMEAKRQAKKLQKELDDELANQELHNTLTSPHMTESFEHTLRADNPNRHIPYNFKGFSDEKRKEILEEQQRQMQEKLLRKQQEQDETSRYEAEQEEIRKQLVKLERLAAVKRSEEEARVRAEQMLQKREFEARYNLINNVVYTNPVADSYFDQFGTSAR